MEPVQISRGVTLGELWVRVVAPALGRSGVGPPRQRAATLSKNNPKAEVQKTGETPGPGGSEKQVRPVFRPRFNRVAFFLPRDRKSERTLRTRRNSSCLR